MNDPHPPTPAGCDDPPRPAPRLTARGIHSARPRARTPHTPAAAAESFSPTPLTPQQKEVLQAVADQRIHRDVLLGTLEPHLLSGHDVIWTLRALVIRGLVQLQPIGPPRLTARGRRRVDSH